MNHADIHFYFDPLCLFAWMTSKGVRQVAARRDYTVNWRFISLRMLNADSRPPGPAPSMAAPARPASRRTGTAEAGA
jgi:2-hydroxychromene-2-carboxylate isomerase